MTLRFLIDECLSPELVQMAVNADIARGPTVCLATLRCTAQGAGLGLFCRHGSFLSSRALGAQCSAWLRSRLPSCLTENCQNQQKKRPFEGPLFLRLLLSA